MHLLRMNCLPRWTPWRRDFLPTSTDACPEKVAKRSTQSPDPPDSPIHNSHPPPPTHDVQSLVWAAMKSNESWSFAARCAPRQWCCCKWLGGDRRRRIRFWWSSFRCRRRGLERLCLRSMLTWFFGREAVS